MGFKPFQKLGPRIPLLIILLILGVSFLIVGFVFRENIDILTPLSILTIILGAIIIGAFWNRDETSDTVNESKVVSRTTITTESDSTTEDNMAKTVTKTTTTTVTPMINTTNETTSASRERPIVLMTVNAALYGVIAGFAITTTMRFVFDKIQGGIGFDISVASLQQIFDSIFTNPNSVLMGFVFLATAIPFYHGSMIFLSDKSKTIEIESARGRALHFTVLFFQAIIFLSTSFALESFKLVIALFVFLMIVDSIWIIWARLGTKSKPPLGWLGSNLSFTAALLFIPYQSWFEPISLLAVASGFRTVVDYVGFRKMYSK